jgi:ABC-2 type transport system permease protein
MAGVAAEPALVDQLRLVAGLRWNLFHNSLRSMRGRLELVSLIILSATMGLGALAAGVGLGVGAFFFVYGGHLRWLSLLFWGVFLVWQLFPLLVAASSAQFDFTNLLRFPLRYSSFYALSLIYGLLDAPALIGMLWLGCIAIGIAVAKPAMLLWAVPMLLVFAIVNVLLTRTIFACFDRWLAKRRTREALIVVFFLAMLSLQFLGPVIGRWQKGGKGIPLQPGIALQIARALPPGLAGDGLIGAASDSPSRAAASLLLLSAYGGTLAWLLGIRLRAQYRGEDLGESVAPAATPARGKASVRQPWRLPFVTAPTSAVFEKEVRYLLRSGPMLLQLVIPLIILAPLAFSFHQGGKHSNPLQRLPTDLVLPICMAYAFLIQATFVFNSFGFDGNGVQFLFVTPVRFRDVLIGKNLFQGMTTLVELVLVGLVMTMLLPAPRAIVVLATFTALLFASLGNFSVGNLLSLSFPRRMEFGMMRQRRVSGVTMAVSLGMQVALLGISGGILIFCYFFKSFWIAPWLFLALAGAVVPFYRMSLDRCSKLALEKREVLTAELCRQE